MTRDAEHTPSPQSVVVPVEREYRKTATIRASQWFKPGDHPAVVMKSAPNRYADDGVPWIETLEGGHVVTPGDWIATGVHGEHWPIKPDIFAATYAEAAPAPSSLAGGEVLSAGERAFTAWAATSGANGTSLMWTWGEMPASQQERWSKIALAVLSPEAPAREGERLTAEQAWDNLLEKADRNSPVDSPMLLITREEMADYMSRAQSQSSIVHADAKERAIDGLNKALTVVEADYPVAAHFVRNAVAFIEGRAT